MRARRATALLLAALVGLLFGPVARADDYAAELARAQRLRAIIFGTVKADLLIRNVQIVDVYNANVFPGTLLIDGGRIVAVNPETGSARETFDGQGLYAVPGLIDGHFHFESQLVTPTELARAMVPHGVTTVFAECLDLVSAAGDDGLKAARVLFNRHDELPYRIYPFAPGKKVRLSFTEAMLDWDFILGLGELNPSHLYAGDEDLQKIAYARARGKLISGHVGDVGANRENLFPALGTMDDHDTWSAGEIAANLRIGLPSFLLYGLHGIDRIVPGIIAQHLPTDNVMLSTDNLSVADMMATGDLDAAIRQSVAYGLDPIAAIRMASYNTAKHFRMEDRLGSLTPGRYADILLVDDMRRFTPKFVFKGGMLVARDGKLLADPKIDYAALATGQVGGLEGLTRADLAVAPIERSANGRAKVTVFNFDGYGPQGFSQQLSLPVRDGAIVPELDGEKLLPFAIIERFAQGGRRRVRTGFIRHFGLDRGAVAVGFSSPRPYVIVIGTNPADMLAAIGEVGRHAGGFVIADGGIRQSLPMNIHGMMTDFSADELIRRSTAFGEALAALGHPVTGSPLNPLLEIFYLADRHGFLE
jgi:adenine deaminase